MFWTLFFIFYFFFYLCWQFYFTWVVHFDDEILPLFTISHLRPLPFYDCVLTIYVRTAQYNSRSSYLKDTNMSIITIWSVCSKWMTHRCLSQEKVGSGVWAVRHPLVIIFVTVKSGSVSGWSRHLLLFFTELYFVLSSQPADVGALLSFNDNH